MMYVLSLSLIFLHPSIQIHTTQEMHDIMVRPSLAIRQVDMID
jgi:hypothetical protein